MPADSPASTEGASISYPFRHLCCPKDQFAAPDFVWYKPDGMSTTPPRLRIQFPAGTERTLTVAKPLFSIGRRPDNDLVIAEKDISRLQAVIIDEGGSYHIEDRGSTFGTDVNGIRATDRALRNRDVISMGRERQIEITFFHDDRMSQILKVVEAGESTGPTPDTLRKLSILLELGKGLNSMSSLQDMLELTLDAVLDVTGAERGFLALRDESGEVRMRAARNTARESLDADNPRRSHSIVADVIDSGEPCYLTDVNDEEIEMLRRPSINEFSLRSIVCLPLKILSSEKATRSALFPGDSDVVGVIYADAPHATRAISDVTKDLINSIATSATFAVENFLLRQEDLERRLSELDMEREIDRLRLMDRLKTEFLSNVSHELRTPLTAIKGSIDNMLDGVTGAINDRQRQYLERLSENSAQLDRLISDLLDLARIESGTLRFTPRSTSVTRLIDDAAESVRPLAQRREVVIRVEPPPAEIVVSADRDRLMQVLFNLLGNAMKFTAGGGCVTMSATQREGAVLVSVTDTGCGVPEHDLERIFDRFYQSPDPAGVKRSGTGLGLPIARSLVELHGGHLWAERTGDGTRFLFTVPLNAAPDATAAGAAQ